MRGIVTWTSLALAVALAPAPVAAGTAPHPAAGLSIWYPDDWNTVEDEDVLELFNGPDADSSEAYMYFWVVEGDDLEAAAADVDADVAKWVKGVAWVKKPTEGKVNGMDVLVLDGEGTAIDGKFSGKKVDVAVAFVVTPKGKILLVYGQFLKGGPKAAKLDQDVTRIIQGIKPK